MRAALILALALASAGNAFAQDGDGAPVFVNARDLLDLRADAGKLKDAKAKYDGKLVVLTAQFAGKGDHDLYYRMAVPVVLLPRGTRLPVMKTVHFRAELTDKQHASIYRASEAAGVNIGKMFFHVAGTARLTKAGVLTLYDVEYLAPAARQPSRRPRPP